MIKLLSAVANATTILVLSLVLSNPSFAQSDSDSQAITLELNERQTILADFEASALPVFKLPLPATLSERQAQLITAAHRQAEEDKHKNPELLAGILMVETKAGHDQRYLKPDNNCYGIFQIKIGTALHVLAVYPELIAKYGVNVQNKAQLKSQLIKDDAFNTAVASKYIRILMKYGYDSVRELALAYNQGMAGGKNKNPKTFPYSNDVAKHVAKLFSVTQP